MCPPFFYSLGLFILDLLWVNLGFYTEKFRFCMGKVPGKNLFYVISMMCITKPHFILLYLICPYIIPSIYLFVLITYLDYPNIYFILLKMHQEMRYKGCEHDRYNSNNVMVFEKFL